MHITGSAGVFGHFVRHHGVQIVDFNVVLFHHRECRLVDHLQLLGLALLMQMVWFCWTSVAAKEWW